MKTNKSTIFISSNNDSSKTPNKLQIIYSKIEIVNPDNIRNFLIRNSGNLNIKLKIIEVVEYILDKKFDKCYKIIKQILPNELYILKLPLITEFYTFNVYKKITKNIFYSLLNSSKNYTFNGKSTIVDNNYDITIVSNSIYYKYKDKFCDKYNIDLSNKEFIFSLVSLNFYFLVSTIIDNCGDGKYLNMSTKRLSSFLSGFSSFLIYLKDNFNYKF